MIEGLTIEKIIEEISKQRITITQWLVGFFGVIFIRFILEQLSNPTNYSGVIASDAYTLIHYGLFYLAMALTLAFILGVFTKKYEAAFNFSLLALPVIWLAPMIDIATSGGEGRAVSYLFDSHGALLHDFLTFFGPLKNYGITLGIRIELLIIFAFIGLYVWQVSKNWQKTIGAVFVSYLVIFLALSMPGILNSLANLSYDENLSSIQFLHKSINQSNIGHNTLRDPLPEGADLRFFELTFNKFMSQIFFILSLAFTFLILRKTYPEKLKSVIKNCRIERVLMYLCLVFSGSWFAYFYKFGYLENIIDILSLACLGISWVGAWMYSVHTNDIEDVEIDKVSNTERPLINQSMTKDEMRQSGYIWLFVSLLGSWCAGFYPFFMNLVFLSCYYIYSAPPLRLKRVPALSSFIISIACLSSVLAGFFFVSFDKRIVVFPGEITLAIITFFFLVSNIRDLKDISGDRKAGILTIPVIFGEKSFKIIGFLTMSGILLVPLLIDFYQLYFIAVPAAGISYKIITNKPYKEILLFFIFFVFLIGIIILTVF